MVYSRDKMSAEPKFVIFMGLKHSGKSTLCRLSAQHFGLDWVDLDELIARIARSRFESLSLIIDAADCVRTLYREHGKQVFQQLEMEAVHAVVMDYTSDIMLSLGGGTMENEAAMRAIHEKGLILFLDTPCDILFERIMRGGIPAFLDPENPRESFNVLFEKRREAALIYADHCIDLGDASIETALEHVQPIIKEYLDGR